MAGSREAASRSTMLRLLAAAEQVFAQQGYEGAGIREIAARARVNPASIQYHFGGKRKLYLALLESRVAAARQVFDAAAGIVESAAGRPLSREILLLVVRTMLRDFMQLVQEHPAFHRIMRREQLSGMPMVRNVLAKVMPIGPLVALLQRAQAEGLLRGDVPPALAATVVFGVHMHCFDAAPLVSKLCGIDPRRPKARNALIDTNLRLLFEGMWSAQGAS